MAQWTYEYWLLAHIAGVLMLAGGVCVSVYAKAAARRSDDPRVISALWSLAYRAVRGFAMPGSLLVIVAGIGLVVASDGVWNGNEPWILGAVIAWFASAMIGSVVHGPHSRAVRAMALAEVEARQDRASAKLVAMMRERRFVSAIDTALLGVMVTLMVLKPGG